MKNKSLNFILILFAFFAFCSLNSCKSTKKMAGATKAPENKEATQSQKPSMAEKAPENNNVEKASPANETRLENYFNAIASSPSVETANSNISEALTMFETSDVPVIIAFFRENGVKDYDEPTTIKKYLNYLKDQKKNPNRVDKVITNDDGKIVELDLIKR